MFAAHELITSSPSYQFLLPVPDKSELEVILVFQIESSLFEEPLFLFSWVVGALAVSCVY